jgi:acetyl/propionyl-CoA carboxylase alpha subunit
MIAKLIVWGEDRPTAIKETKKALNKLWIRGLKTTIPFFKALLNHKTFKNGEFTTAFIGKDMEVMYETNKEEEELAAWFATLQYVKKQQKDSQSQVDFEQGKNINPWVLNKRLKSF